MRRTASDDQVVRSIAGFSVSVHRFAHSRVCQDHAMPDQC